MSKALLGIGTNIGDRLANIDNALEALKKIPGLNVIRVSHIYETKPWGFKEQQNFYNAVIEVETELTPNALLGVCLGVEAGLGRVRVFKNGPRVIDVDLLLYENEVSDTKELKLPHPFIKERDFVLVPLKDLYDDLKIFGYDYIEDYNKIYVKDNITVVK